MGQIPDAGDGRSGSKLDADDPAAAHGAALGVGGLEGWWAWMHRRRTRRGIDAVSPVTARGAAHVALWFCGLAAITLIGSVAVGGPTVVWFAIGLAVMLLVGRWWDTRHQPDDDSAL